MTQAQTYLDVFSQLHQEHAGPIEWSLTFDFGQHTKHIVFGGITHGNETGSLPAMAKMAQKLADGDTSYGGRVTLMLGNIKACLADKRFLEADLNRVFLEEAPESLEKDRAFEMMKILIKPMSLWIFTKPSNPRKSLFIYFRSMKKAINGPAFLAVVLASSRAIPSMHSQRDVCVRMNTRAKPRHSRYHA